MNIQMDAYDHATFYTDCHVERWALGEHPPGEMVHNEQVHLRGVHLYAIQWR